MTISAYETGREAIMNAMIVYDDRMIAVKAKAMLDRAAQRADEALFWSVKPWRVDMLLWPTTAGAAFADAQDAQLIVLALREPTALPVQLVDWLEQWALRRQVPEAALAVFDGSHGDSLAPPPTRGLSQFAARHGLCFILDDVLPGEDAAATFRGDLSHPEAEQLSLVTPWPEQRSDNVFQP